MHTSVCLTVAAAQMEDTGIGSRKLFLKACWGPFTKPCPGPDQEHAHGFQGLKHKETSYKMCGSALGPVSDFVTRILK